MKASGWPGFTLWALVGVLYAFACLGMMSIGVFILFVAIGATIAAARTLKAWPEIFGLAAGPALLLGWIAFRAWPLPTCGPGQRDGTIASEAASYSYQTGSFTETVRIMGCTSVNAPLLMGTALVVLAAAVTAYAVISARTPQAGAVSE